MMSTIEKLQEWYRLRRKREFVETHDKEVAWNIIQGRIQQHRVNMWRRWSSMAATIILVAGVGLWLLTKNDTASNENNQEQLALGQKTNRQHADVEFKGEECIVSVPLGAAYTKQLSDGTHIIINAGTKLTYPKSFDATQREVALEGEAYFDVAHNDKVPFIVSTPSGTIEVLGTQFNVVADAEETTVTLEEGSVRLHFGDREFLMRPGEHACMRANGEFDVHHVDTDNYTSWSTGVYDFTDASLEEIVRQLSLWYDVKINIADEEMAETHYTGVIVRDQPLQEALSMMAAISELTFEETGNAIEVKSKH